MALHFHTFVVPLCYSVVPFLSPGRIRTLERIMSFGFRRKAREEIRAELAKMSDARLLPYAKDCFLRSTDGRSNVLDSMRCVVAVTRAGNWQGSLRS